VPRKNRNALRTKWKTEGRCENCGNSAIVTTFCARCLATRDRAANAYNHRLRTAAYAAYGGPICACCGETEPKFLSIDHVNDDGADHRREIESKRTGSTKIYVWLKQNGYPPGFRVLCMNCNMGRWRNGGVCPHEGRIGSVESRRRYGESPANAGDVRRAAIGEDLGQLELGFSDW
jgi:hypothetical protein